MTDQELEFLQQSNFIENEYSSEALDQAVKAWEYLKKQKKLTIKNILKTHEILSKGFLDKENSGHFRKQPVWIGGHEAKPWYAVPELMNSWIRLANQIGETTKDPTQLAGLIQADHVRFEAIHPFVDFNGRIGRLLFLWQRIKVGLPILVIREEERQTYYKWFNK